MGSTDAQYVECQRHDQEVRDLISTVGPCCVLEHGTLTRV